MKTNQKILANSPEGATHYLEGWAYIDCNQTEHLPSRVSLLGTRTEKLVPSRSLDDIRRIIELETLLQECLNISESPLDCHLKEQIKDALK